MNLVTMDLVSMSAMAKMTSRLRSLFGEKERWICVRPQVRGTSRRADAADRVATDMISARSNNSMMERGADWSQKWG